MPAIYQSDLRPRREAIRRAKRRSVEQDDVEATRRRRESRARYCGGGHPRPLGGGDAVRGAAEAPGRRSRTWTNTACRLARDDVDLCHGAAHAAPTIASPCLPGVPLRSPGARLSPSRRKDRRAARSRRQRECLERPSRAIARASESLTRPYLSNTSRSGGASTNARRRVSVEAERVEAVERRARVVGRGSPANAVICATIQSRRQNARPRGSARRSAPAAG
jgi:hypothetical protein